MIEKVIDTMKTSPEDLPVLLVGGGAVIAPDALKGASKVLKPQWSGVANAIGAAIARVSAVIDTVESTETKTTKELLDEICKRAIGKAVEGGAAPESVSIVEMESLPLQVGSEFLLYVPSTNLASQSILPTNPDSSFGLQVILTCRQSTLKTS